MCNGNNNKILDINIILKKAKLTLNGICKVCKYCDGTGCKGELPGIGGYYDNTVFIANYKKLHNINIDYLLIGKKLLKDKYVKNLQKLKNFFDTKNLKIPIFIAPITGMKSNFKGVFDEKKFFRDFIIAAHKIGSIYFIGDGSSNDKYKFMFKIFKDVCKDYPHIKPNIVFTLKPRVPISLLIEKIKFLNDNNVSILAIDFDGFAVPTMQKNNSYTGKLGVSDYLQIRKNFKGKIIYKGVIDFFDAYKLVETGADSIIISNHGGRLNTYTKATIDVLKNFDVNFLKKLNPQLIIGIDGGFRTGEDYLKAFYYNADYVLIGRPFVIYYAGAGINGIISYFNKLINEINTHLEIISL